jgi:hypothetical protein
MQINLPDSGTFFFISDHCHVIENVSLSLNKLTSILLIHDSGVMVSLKDGLLETTQLGSRARSV